MGESGQVPVCGDDQVVSLIEIGIGAVGLGIELAGEGRAAGAGTAGDAGKGEVEIKLTVDGVAANTLRVYIK